MGKLPRGRIIRVEMDVVINCDVDEDDALEYIKAELTQSGGYSIDNPLSKAGFETLNYTAEDTGQFVSFSISNVEKDGNTTKYRMSKPRSIDRRSDDEIAAWKTEECERREAFAKL